MHVTVLQLACIYLVYGMQYRTGRGGAGGLSQICVHPCQVRISLIPRLSERKFVVQAMESWAGSGNEARSGYLFTKTSTLYPHRDTDRELITVLTTVYR